MSRLSDSPARENILNKIRGALSTPSASSYAGRKRENFFRNKEGSLVDRFCSESEAIEGRVILCPDIGELLRRLTEIRDACGWDPVYCNVTSLPGDFGLTSLPFVRDEAPESAEAVITGCECLVARTGSVVLSAAQDYGRGLTIYAPVHIVVATASQLVADVADALEMMICKYGNKPPSAIYFSSGPSRTGDIEKTLVKGVHGPVEVYIFLYTQDPGQRPQIVQLDSQLK